MKFAIALVLVVLASSPAAAQTVYTTAASFSVANPGAQSNSFSFSQGLTVFTPAYTLNGVTFSANPLRGYNDSGYGSISYLAAVSGAPLTVTSNSPFGLNLGSYSAPQTITYTFGGTTGSLALGTRPATSFIGFSNGGAPISVTFAHTGELDVTSFLATPAAPEPATWGLMILGFGAVGGVLRRKRAMSGRLTTV